MRVRTNFDAVPAVGDSAAVKRMAGDALREQCALCRLEIRQGAVRPTTTGAHVDTPAPTIVRPLACVMPLIVPLLPST